MSPNIRIPILVAAAAVCWLLAAPQAMAQGTSVLHSVAETYEISKFHYNAPQFDGWRQIDSGDALLLVYAEQVDDVAIRTRCSVVMRAYEIEDPREVKDAEWLAQISRIQQLETRAEHVVSDTPVERVSADSGLYRFKIVSKEDSTPDGRHELFYVVLAPDKSEYVVVHFVSEESGFDGELYFQQFYGSLASLEFAGPKASEETESEPAGE